MRFTGAMSSLRLRYRCGFNSLSFRSRLRLEDLRRRAVRSILDVTKAHSYLAILSGRTRDHHFSILIDGVVREKWGGGNPYVNSYTKLVQVVLNPRNGFAPSQPVLVMRMSPL